jgi:peptidoglycan hydrolase-like protein with peptidoglycan-binding domain
MPLTYPPFVASEQIRKAAENSPWMKWGQKGPGVAILQGALIDLGYTMPISIKKAGTPDGIYGDETYKTVLKFQTDQKLRGKDGTAGQETFAQLDALLSARKKATAVKLPPPPPVPPRPTPPTRSDYKIGSGDPSRTHDPGAGVWNSEDWTVSTVALKAAILEILPPRGSSASLIIGSDAARHMKHYMDNTGLPLTIDLEGMIDDVPDAKARFRSEVSQAQRFVESLPVGTHQITSTKLEQSYNHKKDSWNWFYAVGGYSTWGKGKAAVTSGPAGREYRLEFEYKFYDRYNWDGGKQVTIGPVTITDEFMAEFHRQGLAREFDMFGSIKRTFTWKQGDAIPGEQYEEPFWR